MICQLCEKKIIYALDKETFGHHRVCAECKAYLQRINAHGNTSYFLCPVCAKEKA